jgi:pyruvate,water dikinase
VGRVVLWALAAGLACVPADPAIDSEGDGTTAEPTTGETATVCGEAEARLGVRVCVHAVDAAVWNEVALPVERVDQVRTGKYLVPARADARLPALVMDVHAYDLHLAFLRAAFPELFGGLTPDVYEAMITDPAEREFFAGPITEYRTADDRRVFGFVAWDPQTDPASTLTCAQFQAVHAALAEVVTAGPLAAVPTGDLQRAALAGCDVPQFDAAAAVDYEAYTVAAGFGTIRRYTPTELAAASHAAAFGFQDILVLQEAPLDVERVISGAVTGGRQAELSHLNVRSAARGTPNCYLRDAYARMAEWDGQLVRLECGEQGLEVRAAAADEAQAWWDQLRPEPVEIPGPDLEWSELSPLLALPTATADERALGVRRYGAKGRNLAALYQRIDGSLQLPGFLVPVRWYDEFVRTQQWTVDLGDGVETLSFAAAIAKMLADPAFRSDPALRRQRLDALYEAMRDGGCDQALIQGLRERLLATFGSDAVMVRFRSSSNAEDALGFSGAGLYESTNACLADDGDGDADGPSRCDADEPEERGVCRALKKVWASLWLVRAFEEREWYGMDHARAAMGVLVDERYADELANMVVFTGDPNLAGDDRFLINAQAGDLEVVSPDPGTWPERTRLTVVDGEVTLIDRVEGSSELPDGGVVVSDAQLRELGAALSDIQAVFPIDDEVPEDAALLLDTEWKIRPDGSLLIKQVRPYLRRE